MALSTTTAAAGVAMLMTREEEKTDVVFFTDTITPLKVAKDTKLTNICSEVAEQVKKADEQKVTKFNNCTLYWTWQNPLMVIQCIVSFIRCPCMVHVITLMSVLQ